MLAQPLMPDVADHVYPPEDEPLLEIFYEFTSMTQLMSGQQFIKLCKDCKIINKRLLPGQVDVIFHHVVPIGERKIDFVLFKQALGMIAQRKNTTQEKLIEKIVTSEGPVFFSKCPPPNREAFGPERFYFDESTYTQRHRANSPENDASPAQEASLEGKGQSMRVEHVRESPERRKKGMLEREAAYAPNARQVHSTKASPAKNRPLPHVDMAAVAHSLDVDNDGHLTIDEYQQFFMQTALLQTSTYMDALNQLDSDGTGMISINNIMKFTRRPIKPTSSPTGRAVIQQPDRNQKAISARAQTPTNTDVKRSATDPKQQPVADTTTGTAKSAPADVGKLVTNGAAYTAAGLETRDGQLAIEQNKSTPGRTSAPNAGFPSDGVINRINEKRGSAPAAVAEASANTANTNNSRATSKSNSTTKGTKATTYTEKKQKYAFNPNSRTAKKGPERFFYDKNSYVGVHRPHDRAPLRSDPRKPFHAHQDDQAHKTVIKLALEKQKMQQHQALSKTTYNSVIKRSLLAS